jgi:mannose-6-phosphate isomerase-like protein (cupin superfamily)
MKHLSLRRLNFGWKVLLPAILLCAGFLVGHASPRQAGQSSPMPPPMASGPGVSRPAPPKAVDGQGMYWSIEDLKKVYAAASATAPAQGGLIQSHLAWTPEYRLTVVNRPHVAAADAGAEMHEDKTQIYFIISGTGTQVLGGQPAKDNAEPEGQHSSKGPLTGGQSYRVKPGDVILIPPMTWHQTLPDEGQAIVYSMVHIETRHTIP